MKSIIVNVSRPLLRAFRSALIVARVQHPDLTWREGKGLFTHNFNISGPDNIITAIRLDGHAAGEL